MCGTAADYGRELMIRIGLLAVFSRELMLVSVSGKLEVVSRPRLTRAGVGGPLRLDVGWSRPTRRRRRWW